MKAIDVLEKEWLRRVELVENGETLEKTFQRSNLFYNFLFACRKYGVRPVAFAYFKYNLIYALEEKHGYTKEQLNIHSKPDAVLYRRFGTEFIKYEHTLYKCIGILGTEKSGIAEPLQSPLSKRGIFAIDTQGIQGRYAMQIMQRYAEDKKPVFTMSDYDISGCFMMKRYQDIGAHRITLLDVIKHLNLDEKEFIQEDESPKNNHWNSIDRTDKDWLRPNWHLGAKHTRRIEIDVVMSHVSVNTFCDAVLDLIDKYIPVKNVSSVMIHPKYPTDIKSQLQRLDYILSHLKKYKPTKVKIYEQYKDVKKTIKNINLEETEEEAQDTLDEDVDYEDEYDALENLINLIEDEIDKEE